MIAMSTDDADGLVIDPVYHALYQRAVELAEADVREGADPQLLFGELANVQDVYDDTYLRAAIEQPKRN